MGYTMWFCATMMYLIYKEKVAVFASVAAQALCRTVA